MNKTLLAGNKFAVTVKYFATYYTQLESADVRGGAFTVARFVEGAFFIRKYITKLLNRDEFTLQLGGTYKIHKHTQIMFACHDDAHWHPNLFVCHRKHMRVWPPCHQGEPRERRWALH